MDDTNSALSGHNRIITDYNLTDVVISESDELDQLSIHDPAKDY